MASPQEREAFEAWAREEFRAHGRVNLDRDQDGEYRHFLAREWRAAWQAALAASPPPTTEQPPVATQTRHCWLVGLCGPLVQQATYHTGFTWVTGDSRSTTDHYAAKRYPTKDAAQTVADKLGSTLTGTWQAVEHGFEATGQPLPNAQGAQPVAFVHCPGCQFKAGCGAHGSCRRKYDAIPTGQLSLDAGLGHQAGRSADSLGASPSGTACSGPSAPEPKVSALRVPPAGAEQ